MDGVVVKRWQRYGHDRLYVTTDDGAAVGWVDLKSGELRPASPNLAATLTEAVASYLRTPVTGAPPDPEVPWTDLAAQAPGALVRAEAAARQHAAPVRTLLARLVGARTEERAWRLGAVGEEKVAAQLAKVAARDPRWRFLHAIPVGERGSDIDHLVVGPAGVWTVNAKNHPGAKIWVAGNAFLVNGQRRPYIRNSRHEAERAARLLSAASGFSVTVLGLVVPVRAEDVVVKERPQGVDVVPRFRLARWLLKQRPLLDDGQVEAIFTAARRSTTWQR